MTQHRQQPTIVLICHENDPLDSEGLASWLASTMNLTGLIVIREGTARRWRVARRQIRREGWLSFADVLAFRLYSAIVLARRDGQWKERALMRLRARFRADLGGVRRLVVSDPNSREARAFLSELKPDLLLARCKFILKPEIFNTPARGTFVLHPGMCPEYRNAHGCFWALVNRDHARVGMTLLKIDEGVDTGPVYLQLSCEIDEVRQSHTVIQYRVVLENLDAIGRTLRAIGEGQEVMSIDTTGRRSATWGQPGLSDYLRWKWEARRSRRDATRIPSLS
jgi:folate-dependent phosphoribosylglycinamide formyltransferase PurN